MMKKLLTIAVCSLWFVTVQAQQPAQQDKITNLISDREQLVLEYQYYNQQNSNFWGKKSKKDLIAIIETLKKIINKDSELINAVKETSIKKIAENAVKETRVDRQALQALQDQRAINDRISNLQGKVAGLENQVKLRERKVAELETQLIEANEGRYGKDKVITILAGVAALFLLYAIVLQIRLNKSKAAPPRKRAKKI
jgi:CRISPR/Cas system-associated endoribonuclease Cas2